MYCSMGHGYTTIFLLWLSKVTHSYIGPVHIAKYLPAGRLCHTIMGHYCQHEWIAITGITTQQIQGHGNCTHCKQENTCSISTDGCHNNIVQYNMILHTAVIKAEKNISWLMASYGCVSCDNCIRCPLLIHRYNLLISLLINHLKSIRHSMLVQLLIKPVMGIKIKPFLHYFMPPSTKWQRPYKK